MFCFCFVFLRESLIRTAFQCLQLVVTDFLPTMPCTCLQIVVEVAGSFGLHNQELNISLTSIGLLVSFTLAYSDAASSFFIPNENQSVVCSTNESLSPFFKLLLASHAVIWNHM